MPKKKHFNTNGKGRSSTKNYKHSKGNKFIKKGGFRNDNKNNENNEAPTNKNFKHIQRNKDAEEALRRQQLTEKKYQKKYETKNDSSSSDEEKPNDLDQLLLMFKSNSGNQNNLNAIESNSEESDVEEEEDELGEEEESSLDEFASDDEDVEEEEEEENDEEIPSKRQKIDEEQESVLEAQEEEELVEESDEEEFDSETEDHESKDKSINDPFLIHLDNDLSPDLVESLSATPPAVKKLEKNWPSLGRIQIEIPKSDVSEKQKPKKKSLITLDDEEIFASEGSVPERLEDKNFNFQNLSIKVQMHPHFMNSNKNNLEKHKNHEFLTPLQSEVFSIVNNYQDLYFPNRNISNAEELRFIYCTHALNHVLKTRTKILHHNARLSKISTGKTPSIIPDAFRDQGLVRPKVLILVPFRESAKNIVNTLISLISPELSGKVMNHKRFMEEFGGETISFPKKNPKPEDYEQTFAGNTDDTFRIGISLTKKCIKLYSPFYASDILIASPLGLRMIIGAPGEKERDYDFLASIELMILDQSELFLAQNWDHLLHCLDHLHLQPQSARNTDFSRVRSWCLNGWSRFYRQTLLFSSHELPEFRSLFNSRCTNYRGKVRLSNPVIGGSIRQVAVQIPQVFHRIEVNSLQSSFDTRFDHFVNIILPQCKTPSMAHCLIYVPSYFDFIRIRNYFKKETMSFVQICEYTKDAKIARARDMFFHSSAHFLVYSERAHFFRRARVKGIRHLVMYQPPSWPNFYPEMINFMQEANQNRRDGGANSMTVTVLYTKYDMMQVSAIVGSETAGKMITSEKSTHMFMTGD